MKALLMRLRVSLIGPKRELGRNCIGAKGSATTLNSNMAATVLPLLQNPGSLWSVAMGWTFQLTNSLKRGEGEEE